MNAVECPREQELLDALASSRWPERCEPEFRAHVDNCALCADTLAVAWPLLIDGEAAYAGAHVPASGTVWWKAQMRARREAARVANRPISIVQAIALVCVAGLLVWAAYWMNPGVPNWRDWIGPVAGPGGTEATSLLDTAVLFPSSLLPWLILGVWLVLVPLAIYLAVADDASHEK